MKNKKTLVFALSAVAMLGLVACGTNANPAESSEITTSSESSESQVTKYTVTDALDDHVTVFGLEAEYEAGETVTFTLGVQPGYDFTGTVVAKKGDETITVTKGEGGVYSFTMPEGNVTIEAEAKASVFALHYALAEHIDLEIYNKVMMTSKITADKQAIAGIYNGTANDYYNNNGTVLATQFIITADGEITLKVANNAEQLAAGQLRYSVKGSISDIDKSELWLVSVDWQPIVKGEKYNYQNYTTITGTITIGFEGEAEAPVAKIASSNMRFNGISYSYGLYHADNALTEAAPEVDPEAYVYELADHLPDSGEYQETFYAKVPSTNYYELAALKVDGKVVEANDEGFLPIQVGYHKTSVQVIEQVRYSPIAITSDNEYVTVKAYVKEDIPEDEREEEGPAYRYVEATGARYQEQVFFKVFADEAHPEVLFQGLRVTYNEGVGQNVDTKNHPGEFKINEDGYYESKSYSKMVNMDLGLVVRAESVVSWVGEESPFLAASGTARKYGTTTDMAFSADEYGVVKFGSDEFKFTEEDYDAATGKVSFHKYQSADVYSGYFANGIYAVANEKAAKLSDYRFGAVSKTVPGEQTDPEVTPEPVPVVPTFTEVAHADGSVAVVTITNGEGVKEEILLAKLEGDEGVAVHSEAEIEVLNGKESFAEAGAVYDIKVAGETVKTLRTNEKGTMEDFVKGTAGTFTNADEGKEAIVSDGLGGVTYNGITTKLNATATIGAKEYLSFMTEEEGELKLSTVVINAAEGTYEVEEGANFNAQVTEKTFAGANISFSNGVASRGYSNYFFVFGKGENLGKIGLKTSNSGTINYGDILLDGTGKIAATMNGTAYTVTIGYNGESVVAISASGTVYVCDANNTANYYSSMAVACAKVGESYLLEMKDDSSYTGHTLSYSDPNGADIHYVEIEKAAGNDKNWMEEGALFTIHSSGTVSAQYLNIGAQIIPSFNGTYVTADGKAVVISGLDVTVDGETGHATYDEKTGVLTYAIEAMEEGVKVITTYELTIDKEAGSATIEQVSKKAYYTGTEYFVCEALSSEPWTLDEATGTWTSSSGHHSSTSYFKITAVQAGTLAFNWGVSSEANWDYMLLWMNGTASSNAVSGWTATEKSDHSGEKSGYYEIDMAAEDVLYFGYCKDTSGNSGLDKAWVSNIAMCVSIA